MFPAWCTTKHFCAFNDFLKQQLKVLIIYDVAVCAVVGDWTKQELLYWCITFNSWLETLLIWVRAFGVMLALRAWTAVLHNLIQCSIWRSQGIFYQINCCAILSGNRTWYWPQLQSSLFFQLWTPKKETSSILEFASHHLSKYYRVMKFFIQERHCQQFSCMFENPIHIPISFLMGRLLCFLQDWWIDNFIQNLLSLVPEPPLSSFCPWIWGQMALCLDPVHHQ